MFEAFYNLSDNPFRLTPDPKFCFRHPGHDQAYAYLQYALRLGEGFIMVTGRPGVGKTTLAQVFLGELETTEVVAARVATANVETTDLMRVVAYSYGIDVEGLDKATILVRLKQFFVEETRSGKRVLLIIDEAQGLPYPALEELRLLADLQMDARPLVQLFLVGQEKLHELMQEPAMEQFQQRVIGVCHLEPLCLADTRAYMEHRLRKAGWKGDPELTGEALLAIYQYSKGVPRHINKICTRLLLDGFMKKKHELDRDDVREVADALRAEQLAPLGDDRAAAKSSKDTGLMPELENGRLTVADLALRADQQQSPFSAPPVTPEGVARIRKRKDAGYTKQTTTSPGQTETNAAQAGAGMVLEHSGEHGSSNRQKRRPAIATGGRKPLQRQCSARARIPAWQPAPVLQFAMWKRQLANAVDWVKERMKEAGRQLDIPGLAAWLRHYRDEIGLVFGAQSVFRGRPGMWIGAIAALALALTVALDTAEEEVGSHSVMLEDYPKITGVTTTTGEDKLPAARADDYKEFESASLETFGYRPIGSRVEEHSDNRRFVNNHEPSQRDDEVTAPPGQGTAFTVPEFDRGRLERNGTEESKSDETKSVTGAAETARGNHEEPARADLAPDVIVAMSRDIEDTANAIRRVEPAVEPEGAAEDGRTVVTGSPVEVTVTVASSAPEPASREARIIELLSVARQALRDDRLLFPTGDSAYQHYQQVLELEPDNHAALSGMDQIVERYVELCRDALDRQDREKAKRYIARGYRVLPGDSRLVALEESVDASVEPVVQVKAQPAVPEKEPVKTEPAKKKNFLSWLRAIFATHQATEQDDVLFEDESY